MDDAWQSGTTYERYMGRWSAPAAEKFLHWLDAPVGRAWLDVGCGSGSLTRLIVKNYQPIKIIAIDASSDFITYAQQSITDAAVDFRVGQAQALEPGTDSIDAAVAGLALNFVAETKAAVAEMRRVTKEGGTMGAFVWDYAGAMQMLRYFWDAAVALDPVARELDEGVRFPLRREGQLVSLFREAGVKQIEATAIEVKTVFADFEDYRQPFLGGTGPAPSYIKSLSEQNRLRLEDQLRNKLPTGEGGSISLAARAWGVKGRA